MFLEHVMQEIRSVSDKFSLTDEFLTTNVKYPDDTTLISLMFEKLQLATTEPHQAYNKWGLKIDTRQDQNVSLGGEPIENVNKFIFSRSLIRGSGLDFDHRTATAISEFARLKRTIFSNTKISIKVKVRLYRALTLLIAIHASEPKNNRTKH